MIEVKICPVCKGQNFVDYLTTHDFSISTEEFTIIQCTTCKLLVTSPRPETEELGSYYDSDTYISHSNKINSPVDLAYRVARNFTLRWKEELISKLSPDRSVLDFGCGAGDFLLYCKNKGWSVTGVEPSTHAREQASNKIGQTLYENLSKVPGSFGIITLWHVLEHVADLDQTIRELKEKLKPDGSIIIAIPNPNSWESRHYGTFWAAFDTPRHLWHFPKHAVQSLFANHGLVLAQTLPMKLDSYYISLMSEKYRNKNGLSIGAGLRALISGTKSNSHAKQTGEYSSLIYVFKNE